MVAPRCTGIVGGTNGKTSVTRGMFRWNWYSSPGIRKMFTIIG